MSDWKFCFYCAKHKPSTKKRKRFPKAICNDCVEVRRRSRPRA